MEDLRGQIAAAGDDPRWKLVSSDIAVCGGSLVFAGTRVHVQSLWNYLAGGYDLATFLDHFPDVSREQAAQVIELAGEFFHRGALNTERQGAIDAQFDRIEGKYGKALHDLSK